jgi:hypothetical protein
MPIERWTPEDALSPQAQRLLKRLDRVRKLLGFLRLHRRRLFDDDFQTELERMYRDTGAGKDPVPPVLMAMAMLVQAYLGVSDAEMVELTVVDLRVQMVLGCLGAVKPAFSQGALCDFRDRLIRTDLDRRVLERTVELARETGEFDHRKLPRTLRLAVDSSPFEVRAASKTPSICSATRPASSFAASLMCWVVVRRPPPSGRGRRYSWRRASKLPSTSTGPTRRKGGRAHPTREAP